ncbi:WD40 repeat domain-containing protein [Candidatus Pacearchaeota archaeon]|nr:WD40 repeat domain-containing protein [Candidatus Pacearchaeota archaeon]
MKNCFIYGSFFLTTLLVWNTNFCIDIGSDSHPTRFNIQQNVNNGDRVAGFASLEGGLKLDGVFVTGIFDSFFPVSNSVDLRCGTLVLDRDFIFGDVAEFTSLGNVVGQCHTMEFSSTVTLVPNDPTIGCCESGCAASNLLDLTSECGEIKSFDWSYDDKFIVTGMGCVCSDRLKVYAFDGSDLTQRVVSTLGSEVVVYAVRWRPETYQFAVGREYSYYGNEFRIFEFDPEENTITEKSSINFNQHVWSVCWHPSGNYIAIGRSSNTYEVAVYSVNSSGVINATPVAYINLSPSNWVVNHNGLDWSPDGQYLVIGTDDYYSANELRVYQFNSGGRPERIGKRCSYFMECDLALGRCISYCRVDASPYFS